MIQENGPTRTYVSDDGIALLLQNGLLAGSRGFDSCVFASCILTVFIMEPPMRSVGQYYLV